MNPTTHLSASDIKLINQQYRSTSKYGAVRCECDGFVFDSQLELNTYLVLKDLHDRHTIKNLLLQHSFALHGHGGIKVGKYIADFVCEFSDGSRCVVEAKGKQTAVWRLKKRLFEAEYKEIAIVLVTADNVAELDEMIRSRLHQSA